RLYREAPVNAIWEGSGNVMCLDVLRALGRDGEAARAVLAALGEEAADLPGARAAVDGIARAVAAGDAEGGARAPVGRPGLVGGAVGRDGEAARAVLAALGEEAADLPGARAAVDVIARAVAAEDAEGEARAAVDRLALLAAAAALQQSAPEVAHLFARTRLEE